MTLEIVLHTHLMVHKPALTHTTQVTLHMCTHISTCREGFNNNNNNNNSNNKISIPLTVSQPLLVPLASPRVIPFDTFGMEHTLLLLLPQCRDLSSVRTFTDSTCSAELPS